MQHLQDGQWEEHGCFVYRVVKPVEVRSTINVGDESRTGLRFAVGSLVSVDLVRPSRTPGSTNGPFLRLSDCSGWLFERKHSVNYLQRLPVIDGLWTFYVDNCPTGMALRCHPFDGSPKTDPEMTYQPMQLIYCDKRVTAPNGVNSYRVQGTEGWVFDKRGADKFMLLPDSSIRKGLFAYEVLESVAIRSQPVTNDALRTTHVVNPTEVICGDVVRTSPHGHDGNGPFVRLTDGSGWLFEKKSALPLLKEIPIETGNWTFKIMNAPAGIGLRRQPIDRIGKGDMLYKTACLPGEQVTCDRKITSSTGINFYRVMGTQGWVFDKRNGVLMMDLINSVQGASSPRQNDAWSLDFVRGAAMAANLKEIVHNPQSHAISFLTEDSVRIDVYYMTRTIGTAIDHPSQGTTQLFRSNCTSQELVKILQNPRLHTGKGYRNPSQDGKPKVVQTQNGPEIVVEQEEDLRKSVLEVDEHIGKLLKMRLTLLESLMSYDDKRAKAAAETKQNIDERNEELAKPQRAKEQLK